MYPSQKYLFANMDAITRRRWKLLRELPKEAIVRIHDKCGTVQPRNNNADFIRKALIIGWDAAVKAAVIYELGQII